MNYDLYQALLHLRDMNCHLIGNRSHPPLVPTLRRGNLILAKAALIQDYRVQRSTFPRRSVGTSFSIWLLAKLFNISKSLNLIHFGMTYLAGRVGSERLL